MSTEGNQLTSFWTGIELSVEKGNQPSPLTSELLLKSAARDRSIKGLPISKTGPVGWTGDT